MNLTHMPYRGAAPALQAVLAGEPPVMLDVTVAVIPHVKAGKLRALMVTGGAPLEQLPGAVPFDSLFPGLGIPGWHGIFTTGGTPKPVVNIPCQPGIPSPGKSESNGTAPGSCSSGAPPVTISARS